MAGRGRKFTFHGAFGSKAKAVRKERRTPGSFVKQVKIKGHKRWGVLTRRNPKKRFPGMILLPRVFLLILAVHSIGCAARTTHVTTKPQSEAALRVTMNVLNETLNQATRFYVEQKNFCASGDERCRLSAGSLEEFRQNLIKANAAFVAAEESIRLYVAERTEENLRAASSKVESARNSIEGARP